MHIYIYTCTCEPVCVNLSLCMCIFINCSVILLSHLTISWRLFISLYKELSYRLLWLYHIIFFFFLERGRGEIKGEGERESLVSSMPSMEPDVGLDFATLRS